MQQLGLAPPYSFHALRGNGREATAGQWVIGSNSSWVLQSQRISPAVSPDNGETVAVLFRRDQQEDHRSLGPLALRITLMGARGSSREP